MERRNLGAGLIVLASSLMLLVGTASAHGTVKPQTEAGSGSCAVRSLPSFIAQGEFQSEGTVGDVIEVSCDPYVYSAGAEVTLNAAQLYDRCQKRVFWINPNEGGHPVAYPGPSFSVRLDVDGNANVGLLAGPGCMVGESLITLDQNEPPYETFTTSFQVLPAVNTPQELKITPSAQVEDAESSSVITIAQAEFTNSSEAPVRLGYEQLFDRCKYGGAWVIPSYLADGGPEIETSTIEAANDGEGWNHGETPRAISLDNNSNGFALIVGLDSCAEGTSLIEADLEESPFTTETASFTVEAPRPERLTEG